MLRTHCRTRRNPTSNNRGQDAHVTTLRRQNVSQVRRATMGTDNKHEGRPCHARARSAKTMGRYRCSYTLMDGHTQSLSVNCMYALHISTRSSR